ncbi:MAG: tRNA lysidine(34) synthetase TilS [Proteobacteria bacterium]|nr:MAG: tRNA lysidine(34) synthetase TilS [Pseudomonadota bacterium]
MARPKPKFLATIRERLPKGGRLLLAVSGGLDSVSLAHAASELSEELNLHLEIAHIDHRLRPSSSKDASFARSLAKKLRLSFHCTRLAKPPKGSNIEDWARKERYRYFAQVLKRRKLDWTLTAHNANDVAETLLMRLLSNKEPHSIQFQDERRKVLRPMLTLTRREITAYAESKKLKWVEDPTNAKDIFLRNRVRNKLIPLLAKEFDPRIVETLANRAVSIAEDIDGIYSDIGDALTTLAPLPFGSKAWLRAVKSELKNLHPAYSWRLAERLLRTRLGFNLGRARSKRLVDLLLGGKTGLELPGRLSLRLKNGGIEISQL